VEGQPLHQQVSFCPTPRGRVAYAEVGSGPLLLLPPPWIGHLELEWEFPEVRAFVFGLAAQHRVVRYDRLGTGMSDRPTRLPEHPLDEHVATIATLLGHLGQADASLLGFSYGGCIALAMAARRPELVRRMVLVGAYADGSAITSPALAQALVATVRAHWGVGSRALADVWVPGTNEATRAAFATLQRASASAEEAAHALEDVYRTDVRRDAALVRAPTLVLHRRGDRAIRAELGRDLAALVPGARLTLLPGDLHPPWLGDRAALLRAVLEFLGAGATPSGTGAPEMETAPDGEGLTSRELEVLRLVAEGLTDERIAQQLVLSPHTVHRHVSNIRLKLDAPSRAAAAAVATRRGLI
jgi:pimeloyl-ACP methyl ester carboxylesterase/DNA-binding CsgD family transcriptional regulator